MTEITTDSENLKKAEFSKNDAIDRDELAAQLAAHGVGAHQIAPAIEKHARELKRRLEFLSSVQIRKTMAAFLMSELSRPYSEPPEFTAARPPEGTRCRSYPIVAGPHSAR